ncbi:MerR family transcriptional regulator [Xylanibacter muris]|uniref:MerR family transcriptional regulator n=1 Tax=Xylanibacter muris TaxID=2736290 RepID=UPI0025A1A7E7|nr:MerR family transcriptional regulator [Xylanibacter muris]
MKKRFYRIREVVEILGITASTLRYWEDEFVQLEPERTPSRQRRYTPEDIEMCKLIKHLLRDKGYSLEYAKKELEVYRKCPPRNAFVCKSADDAINLLGEVAKMVDGNPHAEARIKAVENWINSN